MNINLIARYRKYIEISIWVLIVTFLVVFNIHDFEPLTSNRNILNGLLILLATFTWFYYHMLPSKYVTENVILFSISTYTVFIFTVIDLTGAYDSPFFSLIYIPILISAMMLGIKALWITLFLVLSFMVFEFYNQPPGIYPLHDPNLTFFEKMGSILLIAFVTFTNTREMLMRLKDTVKLKQRTRRLKGLMQKEQAILAAMQEGVFALSSEGRVVMVNKAMEDFLGYKRENILGKHYSHTLLFKTTQGGSLYAESANPVAQALFTRKANSFGGIINSRGGEKRHYVMNLNPFVNENGEYGGIIGVLRDMTVEQQLEEMKIDFVSMAAHELRTPITSIRGYVNLLLYGGELQLKPDQLGYLQRAAISAEQLVTLMDNLLSVAKIERGDITLKTQPYVWEDILKETVQDFKLSAQEKKLKLTLTLPEKKLPPVMVDHIRIKEVLNNLIQNAITYSDVGGVSVEAKYDSRNKMVETTITDTGRGIPKSALPHLFKKFFRVTGNLEQGSKGTGLGLYISKNIITLHKGKIRVTSKLKKGTTFIFSLPVEGK